MTDLIRVPAFVLAKDGKYYEDLVYQDFPLRRAWFVCFSEKEPAEIVIREDHYAGGNFGPLDILRHRGFGSCLRGVMNGRREVHQRFFGHQEGKPIDGHKALSWFLLFKKGEALPTPNENDSCVEIWPVFPNRIGAYFGMKG